MIWGFEMISKGLGSLLASTFFSVLQYFETLIRRLIVICLEFFIFSSAIGLLAYVVLICRLKECIIFVSFLK